MISGPLLLARALLANVRFAVLQIGIITLASTVGIALRQLPDFALQNAGDYASEMAKLRAEYEPTLGPLFNVFERLGLFRVFTSPWFTALLVLLTVSIIVCTWDRLPKIAAATAPSRPEQPDTFFSESLPGRGVIDLPSALPTNAELGGRANTAAAEAKRDGWEVSVAADPERTGGLLLHADRFRRSGRFTLVMHTGLVVMLLGAAASGIFGYTQGILLTDGEALPVGKIGTASGLVIVNHAFSAPRTESGAFADFSTDLGVYVGGEEVARQLVRVNEPLAYDGWSFHQNFFGPAARLEIRDDVGALLWSGDAPFAAQVDGAPYATLPIPGSNAGIEMQLRRDTNGVAAIFVVASAPDLNAVPGDDGSVPLKTIFASVLAPGDVATAPGAGFSVYLREVTSYTGIIARRDPASLLIWIAAALIMGGLMLTLRRPRARLWLQIHPGSSSVPIVLLTERGADPAQYGAIIRRITRRLSGEEA
ncbi:MAG: cytochrome c biogenesis protein ResB [Candidatus Limnocylindrus sp.]